MPGRRTLLVVILLTGSSLTILTRQSTIIACAPAPRSGEWVKISGEAAFLIWNPKTKVEHFIRQANFETKANDFGFLVPTPSQPELGEVASGNTLFSIASAITAAEHRVERQTKTIFGFGDLPATKSVESVTSAMPPAGAKLGASVEVLDEKKVGGYDATVLRADDPKALAEWLETHGYETRPALTEWLQWYTDHHWIITAFKITKQAPGSGRPAPKPVRMSFATDRPFYPYREPTDMRKPGDRSGRTLRVFFLADQKYEGTIGDNSRWPGVTVWADSILGGKNHLGVSLNHDDPELAKLAQGTGYLTEFVDESSPRPGTDEVYFRPAADASIVHRPVIVDVVTTVVVWPGPMGFYVLLSLGLVGVGIIGIVVYRKARGSKPQPVDWAG